MTTVIDGKLVATTIKSKIKEEIAQYIEKDIRRPGLAVIIIGEDPASKVYVKNKIKACHETLIDSHEYILEDTSTLDEILEVVNFLNKDEDIDGILVQLPLPNKSFEEKIINAISPEKDVDGFHPINVGNLSLGNSTIKPCTPFGVMTLLETYGIELKGKKAVVIGRSNIVGKPMFNLLLQKDATVTVCHSKTENLESIVKEADIVIAAIGKAHFIKDTWIKEGAVVVDVGMNYLNDKLVGDVDFKEVSKKASFITPVPGGVGPMTIAMLLLNTLNCFKKRFKL